MEKFTLFYRTKSPFSQWHMADMTIDGVRYNCCEQYMMAEKARLFGDKETLAKIMAASHPREQKALGREVKGFDKNKWEAVARDVVYKANYAKFTQNPNLLQELIKTQGTTLVEASPSDTIWGIGLAEDDPDALDRSKWRGTNWLGQVLTRLRDNLMKQLKPPSHRVAGQRPILEGKQAYLPVSSNCHFTHEQIEALSQVTTEMEVYERPAPNDEIVLVAGFNAVREEFLALRETCQRLGLKLLVPPESTPGAKFFSFLKEDGPV